MAKKVEDISQRTTDYILGSVGFIFPRTEKELDNFNRLYSDYEFDLGEYSLDPDKTFMNSKINLKIVKSYYIIIRKYLHPHHVEPIDVMH